MTTEHSRKKGISIYSENPFWEPKEIKVGSKLIKVSAGHHLNKETGESISHSGIHVIKEIDETQFLKLYTKNIKAIFDLKPTTQRVLQYLMTELQGTPNADAIYLSWVGANQYFSEVNLGVSRSSFQRALKEMIQKGFIAESNKSNLFWFNTSLFFNGNRMVFINEYRKKQTKEIKKESDLKEDNSKYNKQMELDVFE